MRKVSILALAALLGITAGVPASVKALSYGEACETAIAESYVIKDGQIVKTEGSGYSLEGLKSFIENSGCDIEKLREILEQATGDCFDFQFPDINLPDSDTSDTDEGTPENGVTEPEGESTPEGGVTEPESGSTPESGVTEPETEESTPGEDVTEPESDVTEPETVPDVPENNSPGNGSGNTESGEPETDINKLSYAEQVVELVNAERAKAGLGALTLDKSIEAAALVRAREIEISFSHTRPDGRSFSTVLNDNGISFSGAGENIAWGQKSPEEVVNAWMNSPSHRANILNSRFTKIGVGYYQNQSGRNFWTQLFTA